MSYSSAYAAWIDSAGLAAWFAADTPVDTFSCQVLINNLNHLRDTSTQARISQIGTAYFADSDDITGSDQPGIIWSASTPWSVVAPEKLARPVLRIGGYRSTAGTSYMSAGLWPYGARPHASGQGALAFWPETTFTNTTAAIIIEAAADVVSQRVAVDGGAGRVVSGSSSTKTTIQLVTLHVFARSASTAGTKLVLVQLKEFYGP